MKHTIEIDCTPEILMGLHLDAQRFGELIKLQSATALFKEGKLSSGMAARWCGVPRVHFLITGGKFPAPWGVTVFLGDERIHTQEP